MGFVLGVVIVSLLIKMVSNAKVLSFKQFYT